MHWRTKKAAAYLNSSAAIYRGATSFQACRIASYSREAQGLQEKRLFSIQIYILLLFISTLAH
jgi:hypothetical protein